MGEVILPDGNTLRQGPQRVNLEQLALTIVIERHEIKLHENWTEAWGKRGEYERSYTRHFYTKFFGEKKENGPFLENYLHWHKAHYEAETALRNLQLQQLKSKLAIHEAILEEGKKPPLFTGGNVTAL